MTALGLPLERRTIGELLAHTAAAVPSDPFVRWQDATFNYADAEMITNALAAGLRALGVNRGTHVALVMGNAPEFLWTCIALGKLGAIGVPLNTAAKGQLLSYLLTDSDSTLVVADAERVAAVREAAPGVPIVTHVTEGEPRPPDCLATLAELISDGESSREQRVDATVAFDDPWLIMYTSGTTGPSKGVVCPHAHPLGVAGDVAHQFELETDDRLFTCLPLFHVNAFWYSALTALAARASIALVERFSARRFWSDVRRFGATEFNAIMAVTTILQKAPPTPAERDNPVRIAFVVPLPPQRAELEARWGLEFVCNYSMTEITPAAVLRPARGRDRRGTSGDAVEHIDLRIVGDDDMPVPPGVPGEVVVRPRDPWTIFTEYYKKPEATARAFRNLWFHTGDRGYLDEDGWFYFVDRAKDAIRRRGENISAHEIELILETCDAIAEVAAVPVPSELGEDEVVAYVVPRDSTLTERDVIEYAHANLAYYMVPRYVALVDDLPKTATHKKEKYSLRERAAATIETLWDREAHGVKVQRPG